MMKSVEQMSDAEFLRWLANIGQTTLAEETMARRAVSERLESIANFLGGANVSDFKEKA